MDAVYRYQIEQCTKEVAAERVLFIGIYDGKAEKDPSDELIDVLKDIQPKVNKYSGMDRLGKNNQFTDKQSGRPAMLLSIEKIKWMAETEAEVQGSCGFAEWAAHGYSYKVLLDGGRWKVQDSKHTWVW
jgi:hypothetical protein